MKKIDIIIIAGILVLSLLSFAVISHFQNNAADDMQVVIKDNGQVIKTYSLRPTTDETFFYQVDDEENVVTIIDGTVSVSEANCRDQICVHTSAISKPGEIIVCLPHKFTVEIASSTISAELDSISE